MKEKEKKAHRIQLLLRAVVRDPDGKVLSDTGQKPAKSFLIQFLEALWCLLYLTNEAFNATNTVGGEGQLYFGGFPCTKNLRVDAVAAEDRWGLVVGTGDTAETNTDYALETQLTEGLGAGDISHGATVIGTAAVVGANVDLEIKRPFTNLTGSAITVKEAGLYSASGDETFFHCLVRDVFPGPVDVPNYCSLTVYYTLRTTV